MRLFQLCAGGSIDQGLSNLHLRASVWYSCNWKGPTWSLIAKTFLLCPWFLSDHETRVRINLDACNVHVWSIFLFKSYASCGIKWITNNQTIKRHLNNASIGFLPGSSWAMTVLILMMIVEEGQTDNCNPILVSRLNRQLQRARDTTSNSALLIIELYFFQATFF